MNLRKIAGDCKLVFASAFIAFAIFALAGCGGGGGGGGDSSSSTPSVNNELNVSFNDSDSGDMQPGGTDDVSVEVQKSSSFSMLESSSGEIIKDHQQFVGVTLKDVSKKSPKITCVVKNDGPKVITVNGAPTVFTCTAPTTGKMLADSYGRHDLRLEIPDLKSTKLINDDFSVFIEPASAYSLKVVGVQGITSTLYTINNAPSDIAPKYQPIIYFHNTKNRPIIVNYIDSSDSTSSLIPTSEWTYYVSDKLNPTDPMQQCSGLGASDCQIPADGYFAVKLPVLNGVSTSSDEKEINLILKDPSDNQIGEYAKQIRFVDLKTGYVPLYVVNNSNQMLYVVAIGKHTEGDPNPSMLKFTDNVGALSYDNANDAYFNDSQYAATVPPVNGRVLYLPYTVSGKIYITDNPGGFENQKGIPSENITKIPFIVYEYDYEKDSGSNCNKGNNPSYCDEFVFDQSYVNSFYMLGEFDMLGTSGGATSSNFQQQSFALDNNFGLTKLGEKTGFSEIVSKVQSAFDKYNDWNKSVLIQAFSGAEKGIEGIKAPISLDINASPFKSDHYYSDYVNALDTYFQSHSGIYIYLDPDEYSTDKNGKIPGKICVVKGTYKNGELVFTQASGNYNVEKHTYNPYGQSNIECSSSMPLGTTSGYIDNVGASGALGSQVKIDVKKLNACDFLQAAGSKDCQYPNSDADDPSKNIGLWGPNHTFRAWIGETLASFQAVGLLPYCAHPSAVLGKYLSATALASGEGFTNPSCLNLDPNKPVYNLYVKALNPYVTVYTYSYGDFLGLDGTVTYNRNNFPPDTAVASPKNNYLNQLAFPQPVTVTIRK